MLSPALEAIDIDDPDDDTLMAKAEGISGGVRYGPDVSR
nr:phage tail assembly protein T [Enterobacter hormaechei]